MKLQEIFNQLTYGELSNLSIGGGEEGVISEENWDRVIAHINLGLTALYKRFPLKERRIVIELLQNKMVYPITSAYAESNTRSNETKYILDIGDPFKDDILKIENVYTDTGYEFGLNDLANKYSVFTPTATTLRIPEEIVNQALTLPPELHTNTLDLVYRANHPQIVQGYSYFDPETYEVELPYSHLEPLLLFVASRVNNPIGMTNEFHAGNSYAAKYEMACQQLEQVNLRVDQGAQNSNFQRGGWV